jgi:nicotinamide mononucleotide transporter
VSLFLQNIWQGLTTWSLDQANFLLGVVGVWLMIRRSLWAFPVGLLAVTVQGVLFWRIQLFAEAKVQVFYFAGLAYGWWHWVKYKGTAPELPITVLRWSARLTYLAAGLVGTVLWAEYLRRHTSAVAPYRDAFLASFGIVAQVMQARKNLDNWPVWVVVNAAAVVVYLQLGHALAYTAFLYAIYLFLAFAGWREWMRAREGMSTEARAKGGAS